MRGAPGRKPGTYRIYEAVAVPHVVPVYERREGYCRQGLHELTSENTYTNGKGWRLCRECLREARKRSALRHKPKRYENVRRWCARNKDRVSAFGKSQRQKLYAYVVQLKNAPCTDCGNRFPPCAMDFDHVEDNKVIEIARCRTIKQIDAEVAKCELVCANCHRVRTFVTRRQNDVVERPSAVASLAPTHQGSDRYGAIP